MNLLFGERMCLMSDRSGLGRRVNRYVVYITVVFCFNTTCFSLLPSLT